MENLTHVVFILDKSGSMHPYTNDTIGGFNSYLKKENEDPEKFRFHFSQKYNFL